MLEPVGDVAGPQLVLANDVIGAIFAVFAVTYGWVWQRDRDPGMGWFALSWACFGSWFVASSSLLLGGHYMTWSAWHLVLCGAGGFATLGLIDYLEIPAPARRRAVLLALAPIGVMLAFNNYVGLTGALVPRSFNNVPIAAWYTAMGVLIWKACRRDRGADHGLVAATFLLFPPVFIARAIAGLSAASIRHFAAVPFMMFAMSLLTSTLLRRRRTLEAEVARRTAAEGQLMALNSKLERLAYYDDLTGLPNRRMFVEQLGAALERARRGGGFGALMYVDLDNFKHLNDARGHALGDRLLVEVSRRVSEALQPGDMVARLGGDEFVVIINDLGPDIAMAEVASTGIAENIRALLAGSFEMEGNRYTGTGSIGLTLFPKERDDADGLLREADTAMYRAKMAGRDRIACFEAGMQAEAEERLALVEDLTDAIDAGQIDVHVQPQFTAGKIETGGELLLRWTHHRRGPVSPAQFIPVAEESGLILRLGEFVLRRACEALAHLERAGCLIPLSVNISPLQFHQDDFVTRMRTMLVATGAPASHLVFEVTEGLFINNWQGVAARMKELAAMGIRFSIDDFGTGYSSLAYLRQLPLHEIKIDRQFVQNTPLDANDRAIVASIIAVARTFRLRIVAEGVETPAQADILAAEGCDCFQGFYYARPMPLGAWLQGRMDLNRGATERKVAQA